MIKARMKCMDCQTPLPDWDRLRFVEQENLKRHGILPLCQDCLMKQKTGKGVVVGEEGG